MGLLGGESYRCSSYSTVHGEYLGSKVLQRVAFLVGASAATPHHIHGCGGGWPPQAALDSVYFTRFYLHSAEFESGAESCAKTLKEANNWKMTSNKSLNYSQWVHYSSPALELSPPSVSPFPKVDLGFEQGGTPVSPAPIRGGWCC